MPGTTGPPAPATDRVNVPDAVIVAGSIALLNVADILSFVATPVRRLISAR